MTPEETSEEIPEEGRVARGDDRGDRPRAELSVATAADVVRGLPRFGHLLVRLMGDRRVSALDRTLFGATLVYLFTPFDVVPDWIPVLGQLDDLVLVAIALYRLLHRTDERILLEHWRGDEDPFFVIEDLLDRALGALPGWTRRLLGAG